VLRALEGLSSGPLYTLHDKAPQDKVALHDKGIHSTVVQGGPLGEGDPGAHDDMVRESHSYTAEEEPSDSFTGPSLGIDGTPLARPGLRSSAFLGTFLGALGWGGGAQGRGQRRACGTQPPPAPGPARCTWDSSRPARALPRRRGECPMRCLGRAVQSPGEAGRLARQQGDRLPATAVSGGEPAVHQGCPTGAGHRRARPGPLYGRWRGDQHGVYE